METLIVISILLNVALFIGILQASDRNSTLSRKNTDLELEVLRLKRISLLEQSRYAAYKLNAATSEALLSYTKTLLDQSLRENEEIRLEISQIRETNNTNIINISELKNRYIKGGN